MTLHPTWLASVAILASQILPAVLASQCVAYDNDGKPYIFGSSQYGDLALDLVEPARSTRLTSKNGRPAFDGNNTQCFTNQFTNGLYVLGASASSPSDAHIYSFADQSWSTQPTSGGPDPNTTVAILDHDTVVLYAYSTKDGSINALSFSQDSAKSSGETLQWNAGAAGNSVPFNNTGYRPVLGAANNHIQFLNTPGSTAGNAYIFVIHFAYWQPEIQLFGNFPTSHGQTVTIFSNSSSAPPSFAFIPDGGNASYIVNAQTNTTVAYAAPALTDPLSRYAASTTQLLQLSPNGTLAYLNFTAVGANTSWTFVDLSSLAANSTNSTTRTSGAFGVASNGNPSSAQGSAAADANSSASSRTVISATCLLLAAFIVTLI